MTHMHSVNSEARQASALMQVSECFWGGQLREVVHNLTLELDLEMVVSILKDVAAAMAYLHQQPHTINSDIAHQPLCSSKVLHPDPTCKLHNGYAYTVQVFEQGLGTQLCLSAVTQVTAFVNSTYIHTLHCQKRSSYSMTPAALFCIMCSSCCKHY